MLATPQATPQQENVMYLRFLVLVLCVFSLPFLAGATDVPLITLGGEVGAGDYSDPFASGGYSVAYLHTTNSALEFKGLAAATRLTIRYATVNNGTCSVYINGAHATDITVRSTGAWYGNGAYADAVVNMAVPDGATLKLQNDSGDVGVNLDYIMLEKATK